MGKWQKQRGPWPISVSSVLSTSGSTPSHVHIDHLPGIGSTDPCGSCSIQEVSKAVLVPVLPQQLLQASNSSAVEKPSPLFRENLVKSDRSGCNHATFTAAVAVSVSSIWTLRSGRDSADISP